ncbi:MAG: permease [Ardenticatenaceae bacterium]|nr:permease [Ardenticatenaceae bacterium]
MQNTIREIRAGLSEEPRRQAVYFLVSVLVLVLFVWLIGLVAQESVYARFQVFVTIFLGIFVEAAPFLLAGSIVSGLIDIFLDDRLVERVIPDSPLAGAFVGAIMGFAFPVCECGVVPVTRRLYQKGMPLSVGISFLLAAPVVNPIVVASTYAAFGWGPILSGRFIITIAVAFLIGLLFTWAKPQDILRPVTDVSHDHHRHDHDTSGIHFRERLWAAIQVAGNDFIDMARYLIIGSMLAALMQTIVPQSTLLALGGGEFSSVATLMVLAFVLSICSTVDAFLALSFVNTFTTGAVLSFLTFGPMVDIKSSLMFLGVFRRRVVAYLIVLPLLLNLLIALLINMYTGL